MHVHQKLQKTQLQKKQKTDERLDLPGVAATCAALGVLSAFEPTAGFVCTSLCVFGVGVRLHCGIIIT